jgi:hypothetical protein
LIGGIAFIVGRMSTTVTESQTAQTNQTTDAQTQAQIHNETLVSTSGAASQLDIQQKIAQTENTDPLQNLISKNKFQEKNQQLTEHFSKTATGKQFVKMFTFMSMQEMAGTAESKMVDEALEELKEKPQEAIDEFKKNYANLPNEFNNEVTDSVQLISRFDIDIEDRLDFLKTIATNPIDNNQKSFIPTVAVMTLRMMPEGKEFLKEHIHEILAAHKTDKDLKLAFIHEYGILFPDQVGTLTQKYLK